MITPVYPVGGFSFFESIFSFMDRVRCGIRESASPRQAPIDSASRFRGGRGGRGDRGSRGGGAAEAAPIFFLGLFTGGLKERLRTHPPSLRSGTLPTPGRA